MVNRILSSISNNKDKFTLLYLSAIVISHFIWDRALIGLYKDGDIFVDGNSQFSLKIFKENSPICDTTIFNNIPRNIVGGINIFYALPLTIYILKEYIKNKNYTNRSKKNLKLLQILKTITDIIIFSYDLKILSKKNPSKELIFSYLAFIVFSIFQVYNLRIDKNKFDIILYKVLIFAIASLLLIYLYLSRKTKHVKRLKQ